MSEYDRIMPKKAYGFTIVELLIVIVIIAILAAITVVAYNGLQARANDSERISDLNAMSKALMQYHLENGSFPNTAPNPGSSTWEISSDPEFLISLNSTVPGANFSPPGPQTLTNGYWYHRFNAGQFGCPASLGQFFVLWIKGMQTQTGSATVKTNGCDGQTLFTAAQTSSPVNYIYFGFPPA